MKSAGPSRKTPRTYSRHGLNRMKRALYGLDTKALDTRYRIGRELKAWRDSLVKDLGGRKNMSVQQVALVDLCTRTKLMLDHVDGWCLAQRSLVNARRRALLPVLKERMQLADALSRYLQQLGLEKKIRQKTLQELLAEDSDDDEGDGEGQDEEDGEQGGGDPQEPEGLS